MSFVRRLFGARPAESGPSATPPAADPEWSEEERERALMRDEAARLDELQQRQLRYAEHAWRPASQGGERRADDEDRERSS